MRQRFEDTVEVTAIVLWFWLLAGAMFLRTFTDRASDRR